MNENLSAIVISLYITDLTRISGINVNLSAIVVSMHKVRMYNI